MVEDLLPCPFCGCKDVWHYAGIFFVYIECSLCGATIKNSTATVLYHKDKVPDKLVGVQTYEPELLDIRNEDGTITHYPDHGYVGVNAMVSLKAYGVMDRWNRRCEMDKIPDWIITRIRMLQFQNSDNSEYIRATHDFLSFTRGDGE